MEVFELRYPGTWLEGNPEEMSTVEVLLTQLESQLADATIGLELFTEAWNTQLTRIPNWKQRQARRRQIAKAMERQLPHELSREQRWEAEKEINFFSADLQARREQWAAGLLPDSYEHRLPLIHAHTVVYALDAIGKILDILAKMELPPGVTDARNGYRSALPHLVAVRDSAHHTEDRARGLGRNQKPLDLQPMNNGSINAPST
jgi:hypothetical protein